MGIEANTSYNGSYESFLASAFKSKGINISEEDIQDVFSYAQEQENASEGTTTVSKDKVRGAFEFKYGKGEDIEKLLDTFLDVMDNLDNQQDDGILDIQYLDDNYDLEELFEKDSDMYEAIVAYESDGTVTNSNNNSSSNTSGSSTSKNASNLESLIPANPVSYKNLGDASVNYHSEVPDSLRWTGNSTNINVYSLKDGDSSEKFRKINPEDMRYFSKEYKDDIEVKGQEIIASKTGDVIGYWNANEDGTNSFYLKDGITYSSITSYLYPETTENGDNSGSAGDSGSTGDGVKSEARTTFEGSDEWKYSNHKQCLGTAKYFEDSGFTIDGDVVTKDGKTIGICDKIDDNRVNITIINDDSTEVKNLTSGSNTVDGVEQGHYDYTENADGTATTQIYGAGGVKCEIKSKTTGDSFEIVSVKIGDDELTEANFKALIGSIKDPDTLDMLFDSGILNKVQNLKDMRNGHETEYFKGILNTLNTKGQYSEFTDIDNYKPNESEEAKYNELKDNIDKNKDKPSKSLEEILEACEKGEISVTSALYLLNKVAPDLCGDGDDTLEDVFRDMDTPDEEKHISTFLKLIAAANYRTQEDNAEVKSPESADDTKGAAETKEEAAKKAKDEGKPKEEDDNSAGAKESVTTGEYTCCVESETVKSIKGSGKYDFVTTNGESIVYELDDEGKQGQQVGTYTYDKDKKTYLINFKSKDIMNNVVSEDAMLCSYETATDVDKNKTEVVKMKDTAYTIITNEEGKITSLKKTTTANNAETTITIGSEDYFTTIRSMIDSLEDETIKENLETTYKLQYLLGASDDSDELADYLNELCDISSIECDGDDIKKLIYDLGLEQEFDGIDETYEFNKDGVYDYDTAKKALEILYKKAENNGLNDGDDIKMLRWISGAHGFGNLANLINSFDSPDDREKYLKFACDILGEK